MTSEGDSAQPSKEEELTSEELAQEYIEELPEREAMSIIQPDVLEPWPAPLPPDHLA
jgi:hypothetical protein